MLRKSAMYNLKVSTALAVAGGPGGGPGLLAVDPQGVTPRTPEILNSLMAMSHPLDPYAAANAGAAAPNPSAAAAVPELSSPSAASGSSVALLGSPGRSPPSLQHTRSLLIKEGLKLTLQTKRRHTSTTSVASGASVSGASADEDDESPTTGKRMKREQLTPEDEERRRRRRERNKVAATKCRIKKRERTVNLVQESEILESQNYELKSQIQELETQRRRLVDMLSSHSSTCTRPGNVHQAAQALAQPPAHAGLPYDMYSPTTPGPPGADLGHAHHGHGAESYGDVLMGQYGPGVGVGASTAADEDPLPPYFPVTKHEIVDEPLLAGLDDPLDVYAGYAGMTGVEQPSPPASTPGSTTPGSLDSPHGPQHHHHHHHQQHHHQPDHHQQHMMSSALTPLPLSPDNVFGMDSGCMA
ncbi:hypothetical protein ONE63_007498 [Megalurothrips usitatus]|uniref:BZIP domain-containing protein n=1 Tax=Megalurothrips usitatus TaxID=439358 RepID=A0AAV7XUF9_9NEOP|nr:hypothetical protein ONE63_007498 [Megalurothrips usitatus]